MTESLEGYVHVWRPDNGWQVVADELEAHHYRCRWGAGPGRRACGRVSVAKMLRPRHGTPGTWWHYCGEHLYGRRVEDGQVLIRVVRPISELQAQGNGRR